MQIESGARQPSTNLRHGSNNAGNEAHGHGVRLALGKLFVLAVHAHGLHPDLAKERAIPQEAQNNVDDDGGGCVLGEEKGSNRTRNQSCLR